MISLKCVLLSHQVALFDQYKQQKFPIWNCLLYVDAVIIKCQVDVRRKEQNSTIDFKTGATCTKFWFLHIQRQIYMFEANSSSVTGLLYT